MRPKDYFAFLALHYPDWDEDVIEDLSEAWGVAEQTKFGKMARCHALRVQLMGCLAFQPRLLLLELPFDNSKANALTYSAPVRESLAGFCREGGAILCTVRHPEAVAGLPLNTAAWAENSDAG